MDEISTNKVKAEPRKTLNLHYIVQPASSHSISWSLVAVVGLFIGLIGMGFYLTHRRETDKMFEHCVKPNETLTTLASFYYQNPKKWRRIFLANRRQIIEKELVEDESLKVGEKIYIPLTVQEEQELRKRLQNFSVTDPSRRR